MIHLRKIRNLINFCLRYNNIDIESKNLISEIINEFNVKKHFEKYKYAVNRNSEIKRSTFNNRIWQLWYQGIESTPTIVNRCIESVQKFSDGRNVVILDENSIENYISIPGYIYDKKNNGMISNVNFSDLLRSLLLAEHGGTWIDATVMMTDIIPNHFIDNSLFCFSTTPKDYRGLGNILASSWFIHSDPNNPLMNALRNLLLEYWKFEKSARHCYYFHLFFLTAILANEDCKNEWEKVPFFSNVPPQVLQMELFKPYNKERFEQIKKMSSIHKLTFYGGKEFDTKKSNTFYDILINKNSKQI